MEERRGRVAIVWEDILRIRLLLVKLKLTRKSLLEGCCGEDGAARSGCSSPRLQLGPFGGAHSSS